MKYQHTIPLDKHNDATITDAEASVQYNLMYFCKNRHLCPQIWHCTGRYVTNFKNRKRNIQVKVCCYET